MQIAGIANSCTDRRYYLTMADAIDENDSTDLASWDLTDQQCENLALLHDTARKAMSDVTGVSRIEEGRLIAALTRIALTGTAKAVDSAAAITPRLYQCVGGDAVRLAMSRAGGALRGLKRDWDDKAVEKKGTKTVGRRVTEEDGLTEKQAICETLRLLGAKPAGHGCVTVDSAVERRVSTLSETTAHRLMMGVSYCDYRGSRSLKDAVRVALRKATDADDDKASRFIADFLCALACYDETVLDARFPVESVTADWLLKQASSKTLKSLAIDWAIDPESVFPSTKQA